MSSKSKSEKSKPATETTEAVSKPKARIQIPSGPVPIARVNPNNSEVLSRAGRGFSLHELEEANITPRAAKRLGLYVDKQRSTRKEENGTALKSWLST